MFNSKFGRGASKGEIMIYDTPITAQAGHTVSVETSEAMNIARQIFFGWVISLPTGRSAAAEAKKLLTQKNGFWDKVPQEAKNDLRVMLQQTSDFLVTPRFRRGRRTKYAV